MAFSLRRTTAALIDGANLYATTRELNMQIDFKKVLKFISHDYDLLRAVYYTALVEEVDGNIPLQQTVDWLNLNGFLVRTKMAKVHGNIIKGNMDIEICVDAMKMAEHVDHMFLFSGDGDFRYLVEAVQDRGVRVTLVSSVNARICSADLRKQADAFVELSELRDELQRGR